MFLFFAFFKPQIFKFLLRLEQNVAVSASELIGDFGLQPFVDAFSVEHVISLRHSPNFRIRIVVLQTNDATCLLKLDTCRVVLLRWDLDHKQLEFVLVDSLPVLLNFSLVAHVAPVGPAFNKRPKDDKAAGSEDHRSAADKKQYDYADHRTIRCLHLLSDLDRVLLRIARLSIRNLHDQLVDVEVQR